MKNKAQIYMAMEEYAKIKIKEAFVNGYEQGFERGQWLLYAVSG